MRQPLHSFAITAGGARRISLTAAVLVLASACASTGERPDAALAAAKTGIDQAQQSGGAQYGAAELSSAQQKLAAARSAADREEMTNARRLAEEAAVDAELASAMARNAKAQSAVEEVQQTIEALREEISHNQSELRESQ